MSDDNDQDAPSSRWTCEACGCHTNTEASNSASCGICGTRRGEFDIFYSLCNRNFVQPNHRPRKAILKKRAITTNHVVY
jgi:hypothetical protein